MSWNVGCVIEWATAYEGINRLELPGWIGEVSPEARAQLSGQLASGKQAAKLLVRAVSGPRVEIQIVGHLGTADPMMLDVPNSDSLHVYVRQLKD